MTESLLQLKDIHVHYGGVKALDGVSVSLDEGEIVALLGPNGAGKSSILKAIFGLAPIERGEIWWHERPVTPVAHEMVARGISFVPQGRRVFRHLTVRENLELGALRVNNRAELQRRLDEVLEIFPVLGEKIRAKSGTLSGGQQQMLAIGRGLMNDPKVLLLDEPSLGLALKLVKEVFTKIQEIRQRHHTAIFVVEHNLKSLLAIVDRVYLLNHGQLVTEAKPERFLTTDILERVFLGHKVTT